MLVNVVVLAAAVSTVAASFDRSDESRAIFGREALPPVDHYHHQSCPPCPGVLSAVQVQQLRQIAQTLHLGRARPDHGLYNKRELDGGDHAIFGREALPEAEPFLDPCPACPGGISPDQAEALQEIARSATAPPKGKRDLFYDDDAYIYDLFARDAEADLFSSAENFVSPLTKRGTQPSNLTPDQQKHCHTVAVKARHGCENKASAKNLEIQKGSGTANGAPAQATSKYDKTSNNRGDRVRTEDGRNTANTGNDNGGQTKYYKNDNAPVSNQINRQPVDNNSGNMKQVGDSRYTTPTKTNTETTQNRSGQPAYVKQDGNAMQGNINKRDVDESFFSELSEREAEAMEEYEALFEPGMWF